MVCNIPFVSDYMGVGGAYPKVTVDGRHRFLGVRYDIASVL